MQPLQTRRVARHGRGKVVRPEAFVQPLVQSRPQTGRRHLGSRSGEPQGSAGRGQSTHAAGQTQQLGDPRLESRRVFGVPRPLQQAPGAQGRFSQGEKVPHRVRADRREVRGHHPGAPGLDQSPHETGRQQSQHNKPQHSL